MHTTNTYFKPTPQEKPVPCLVIREHGKDKVYVEVLNNIKPGGKPDYTNTSTYGNLLQILKTQLVTA
jgi:hypothetical protein